jgi:hypothetical protein
MKLSRTALTACVLTAGTLAVGSLVVPAAAADPTTVCAAG